MSDNKKPTIHVKPPTSGGKGGRDSCTLINRESESKNDIAIKRRNSMLSFKNLSINDCTSICGDSTYSHYNPSINEPYVSDEATPEERAMHAFLD